MSTPAVGVDLGGTNLKAALVDRQEGLLEHTSRPTEANLGPDHVVSRIIDLVEEMRAAANGTIDGVGIGAPGAVDWDRSTVAQPPNFPDWKSVNLRARLQSALGEDLSVVVENDANVAAFGSAHYGAGTAFDSFIMITLGTGVGGGIIYQNQIFRGDSGGAGEIGHVTIDYEGPYANSGVSGAIESYLGQAFLAEHARNRLVNYPDSIVPELVDGNLEELSPQTLWEAANRGDELALEVFRWAGHKLGCVLGSAVNLLDIRTIIVGGGVSAAGEFILDPARETLPRFVVPGLRQELSIRREKLGNEANLLGAARLIFEGEQAHVGSR